MSYMNIIYGSWDVRCDWHKVLSFCIIFYPFSPLATWKIKILKLKEAPGHITILHICTINDNHMMHGSWDMEHDRQNFLSFWTIYCPFTPLTTWKMKIKKKKRRKKRLDISSFYNSASKIMIICYTVPEIWCVTNVIVIFAFLAIFCPIIPLTAHKIKI